MSHHVKWREHNTTEQLALKFGMNERHVYFWIEGMHVGRMADGYLPKQVRFGELLSAWPFHVF